MDNKEFSRQLEKRTKEFAIDIIRLSSALPNTPEGKTIRNQVPVLEQITGKQTGQEVNRTSLIKLKSVKVKQMKRFIGLE